MIKLASMQTRIEDKRKILYLITKGDGGAQSHVFDLVSELDRRLFEPVVIFGEGENLGLKLDQIGVRNFKVSMKRDMNIKSDLKSFIEVLKIIKQENPDILHLNSPKAAGIGVICGRLLCIKKIVFTVHGLASNEERPFWQRYLILFSHFIIILLSTKTICVSRKTKNDLRELPFIENKIAVIHNCIKPFDFLDRISARKALGLDEGLIFGSICELHKNKGVDIMLDALPLVLKKYPNIKYVVIGDGEEKEILKKKIVENKLENNVILLGKIENAKKYLKAFDIFTLTSRTEALPYVILEAGFVGLPILASRVGGISEIIENDKSGILVCPRKNYIAEGLLHLLENQALLENFAKNIKNKVEKEFLFEKMINDTLKVYTL